MLQFLSLKRYFPEALIASSAIEIDTAVADADIAPTPERACGWFDSSFDLRLGLMVQELPVCAPTWQLAGPSPMH